MKKFILWLLKFYVTDFKFRIKVSSILQEAVKAEYNEQTPYGCLYEGVGEYMEGCELIKKGNITMIKRGIEKQIDISYERATTGRYIHKNES